MAALQCDGSDLIDLSVDQFFDIEHYYGKNSAEPQGAPSAGSQVLSDPRLSSRMSGSKPSYEQDESSEIAVVSQTYAENFTDGRIESLQAPAKHHTLIGNEPLPQYGQPSTIESPNTELQHVENELEEVELRLKRRELQRRRQELLKNLPTEQRAQTSEHPQVQKMGTAIVSPMDNSVDQPYNTPNNTSALDSLQKQNAGIDSHYGEVSTNPLYFGFDNLSSNPQEASSTLSIPRQFDRIDTGLLGLDSVDAPNSMPAPPPDVWFSRQDETQTPGPAFSSDQTSLKPMLAGPPNGQSLDSAQHVSTLSPVQHEAIKSPDVGVITRKRSRLAQPTKARPLSTIQHQLAKRIGVPEASLGVMCFNTEPLPKRSRTGSQKQNKKDVQNGGGSCFLCLVSKKKCSGQRPCENCRNYWQKRVHDSTSFTWTCDVRSKLSDLNIFKYSLDTNYVPSKSPPVLAGSQSVGFPNSTYHDALASQFDGVNVILQKFADLFGLKHPFQPLGPRMCLEKVFDLYTEIHGSLRWVRLLVFLIPRLQHDLAFFDLAFFTSLYRYNCSYIFDECDQAHMSPHKYRAVMIVVLTFYEVKRLMETETIDLAAADHLLLALGDRLKIFCSRIFDFDESKEITRDRGRILAAKMVDCVPELSSCLPPHYRGRSWFSDLFLKYGTPLDSSAAALELPSCLLRRSDISECCYDNAETDSCCCGWTFDSAPSGLLDSFDHSANSFARYVHSKPWEAGLDEKGISSKLYQAMTTVLRESWRDNLILPSRVSIFEQTLALRFC